MTNSGRIEYDIQAWQNLVTLFNEQAARSKEIAGYLRALTENMYTRTPASAQFSNHMGEYVTVLTQFETGFTDFAQSLSSRIAAAREGNDAG